MSEHTPGPWVLEANGAAWNLRSPDRARHFAVLLGMMWQSEGEHDANARLMAAAPSLLAALERVLECSWEPEWPESELVLMGALREAWAAAEAAIALAKGEA